MKRIVTLVAMAVVAGFVGVLMPAASASAAPSGWFCYKKYTTACVSQFGYAGKSVWGYPVDAWGNNCTNYAAFRLSRNGVSNPGNLGNASSWASNAKSKGLSVDHTPTVGSIAQWGSGNHVAYVDWVSSNGKQIAVSDTGYNGSYPSMSGRSVINSTDKGYTSQSVDPGWPNYFIHFKKPTLPVQPGSPAAKAASATSVKLTWKDASNNETSFATHYSTNGGKTWTTSKSAGANATSITLTGLKAKTAYTFQVGAHNGAGTHWSAYAKATTPAAPKVTGKAVVKTQLEPKAWISGVTPLKWVASGTTLTLQCLTTGQKAYGALASADPYYYRTTYSGKTGYVSDSDILTAKDATKLGLPSC